MWGFTKADIYYEYPMARPVKVALIPEGKAEEFQQPSKEEVEVGVWNPNQINLEAKKMADFEARRRRSS